MLKPEKYALLNLNGTVHILNAALESGLGRVVFSSSAATYGEPKYLPIDEKHPTEPENFYGYTKLEIERLLGWYDRLKGLRFAALRYFNAAGYDVKGRIRGPRAESRQPAARRDGGRRGHATRGAGSSATTIRPATARACATTST